MKTAQDYLNEANNVVPKISTEDGIKKHGNDDTLFIDVRESIEINNTGTIKGAIRIPRGLLEFIADENTPYHNKELDKNKEIVLVCGAGGQAALSGKTLKEMGYAKVYNVGGFQDWIDGNGPVEK
tara:strand:+ start:568 stop:942 length:375 start_codon:yes stop_codon:yes gene_type:complete